MLSTGPRTNVGKEKVRRNAWKGGIRPMLRDLATTLRDQPDWLNDVESDAVLCHFVDTMVSKEPVKS